MFTKIRPRMKLQYDNHTHESQVKAVWIYLALLCLISSVLIYYGPESDIRVKSYEHLNFSRASVVQFRAFQYINGLKHTTKSKVKAVWIFQELSRSNLSILIQYWPESNIRVKSYGCMNLPCASYLISSISIHYAPESDIRVKNYDRLNFPRCTIVQFRASRYIMGLNHTPVSKVMAISICWEHSCSNSNVSIYYVPESDIRVKCYDHFNFSRASVVQFRASLYVMRRN